MKEVLVVYQQNVHESQLKYEEREKLLQQVKTLEENISMLKQGVDQLEIQSSQGLHTEIIAKNREENLEKELENKNKEIAFINKQIENSKETNQNTLINLFDNMEVL